MIAREKLFTTKGMKDCGDFVASFIWSFNGEVTSWGIFFNVITFFVKGNNKKKKESFESYEIQLEI